MRRSSRAKRKRLRALKKRNSMKMIKKQEKEERWNVSWVPSDELIPYPIRKRQANWPNRSSEGDQ